jgi:hypothetical protein
VIKNVDVCFRLDNQISGGTIVPSLKMETDMNLLKSLNLQSASGSSDPTMKKRERFAGHLTDQIHLAQNPEWVKTERKWRGKGDARQAVEVQKPVRPWFKFRADGSVVIILRAAGKRLELESGKAAIVAPKGELVKTLEMILTATLAGEVDSVLPAPKKIKRKNNNPGANASAAVKAAVDASNAEMKKRSKVLA